MKVIVPFTNTKLKTNIFEPYSAWKNLVLQSLMLAFILIKRLQLKIAEIGNHNDNINKQERLTFLF